MKNIPLPNKVYFSTTDEKSAVLVMEPLYPGYGVTIGNALRRVLLSSLPGAAVTAVKLKGVDHEFSTVPHVREDVVDIILNLKQLRLKVFSDEPVKLAMRAKGQKAVTAADIVPDSQVEIVNKDLQIATLDGKDGEFSAEITVQQGRGYVPVEMREDEKKEIGVIAVDAIFTPVKNVNFEVENVRVGQITNYDKLTITMETDGTITGPEALDQASQILVDHFGLLLTSRILKEESPPGETEESPALAAEEPEELTPAETVPADDIDQLGLSNRSLNALKRNGISTIAELRKHTRETLAGLDGLGAKSIDEITAILQK